MKFTIIIPTLNSASSLSVTLNSIENQSYGNWECLFIDKQSTDGTLKLIENFSLRNNSKVKLIHQKDEGIYSAFNLGIENAAGNYINFLGSDDSYFSNDVLAKVKDITEKNPIDLLYGKANRSKLGVWGNRMDKRSLYYSNICHQSIFYKRELFERMGLYSLKYKLLADWEFNIKCFLNNNVSTLFEDLIIANYSDEGSSSNLIENGFLCRRWQIYINQGISSIPRSIYKPLLINYKEYLLFKIKKEQWVQKRN